MMRTKNKRAAVVERLLSHRFDDDGDDDDEEVAIDSQTGFSLKWSGDLVVLVHAMVGNYGRLDFGDSKLRRIVWPIIWLQLYFVVNK